MQLLSGAALCVLLNFEPSGVRVTARRGAHGERAAGPAPPLARLPPRGDRHGLLRLLDRLAAAGARRRRQRGAPAHHQDLRARARMAHGSPVACQATLHTDDLAHTNWRRRLTCV